MKNHSNDNQEQQTQRTNNIKSNGKEKLIQKISSRIAKELRNKDIEDLREAFDGLF